MKQSTFIFIVIIWLLIIIFLAGFVGYKLHPCPSYHDSPIELKPNPDPLLIAEIQRLEKELNQKDSLLKINPKIIIYEKSKNYSNLNHNALCDSVKKHFGTGFDML